MVDRRRRALRNATRASGVTALLLPLLAAGPAASDQPLTIAGPGATSAPVGSSAPVSGASISGMEANEVVRVLVGVGSGSVSAPAGATGVTVPAGYPALGTAAPELALEGTQDALNAALGQLRWTPAAAGPSAITIDASPAGAAYDPANGHLYQVVTPSPGLSWDDAKAAAASTTFQGEAGYLATITDDREQSLVATVTAGPAWIGGNRLPSSRTWAWATGPEAGTPFWTPACGAGAQGQCSATNPPTFSMWAPGEPRSFANATVTTFLGGSGGGLWSASTTAATPPSYVVEFGGTAGDPPPETAHAEGTLTGTGGTADGNAGGGGGIRPVTPGPGATPVRSIPTTTTPPPTAPPPTEPTTPPTSATPTTEAPTPPTTEPPVTRPPTTAPGTTATAAPATSIAPSTQAPDTTAATSDAGGTGGGGGASGGASGAGGGAADTTAAADADAEAAVPTAPTGLPIYIVFDVGPGTPVADVRVTVRGYTLLPGSPLTVEAHSTSATLATVPVDALGTVLTEVSLPNLGEGEHTIVATGQGANGAVYQRTTQFNITGGSLTRVGPPPAAASAPSSAPATTVVPTAVATPVTTEAARGGSGGGLPKPLIVALLAAVIGAIVFLVTRRRRAASTPGRAASGSDRPRPAPPVVLDEEVDQYR